MAIQDICLGMQDNRPVCRITDENREKVIKSYSFFDYRSTRNMAVFISGPLGPLP